jgi:hypothetical protein
VNWQWLHLHVHFLVCCFLWCMHTGATSCLHIWKTDCEDGRWIELAHDCVYWQTLVLVVLNLRALLPELAHPHNGSWGNRLWRWEVDGTGTGGVSKQLAQCPPHLIVPLNRTGSWGMTDTPVRSCSKLISAMFKSSILIVPDDSSTKRRSATTRELLPDPVRPTIPETNPENL